MASRSDRDARLSAEQERDALREAAANLLEAMHEYSDLDCEVCGTETIRRGWASWCPTCEAERESVPFEKELRALRALVPVPKEAGPMAQVGPVAYNEGGNG